MKKEARMISSVILSVVFTSDSLEGQVGKEGDSEEDGGNPTSDVSDEGEDGSLQLVSINLPGDVLYKNTHRTCTD